MTDANNWDMEATDLQEHDMAERDHVGETRAKCVKQRLQLAVVEIIESEGAVHSATCNGSRLSNEFALRNNNKRMEMQIQAEEDNIYRDLPLRLVHEYNVMKFCA
eukprot:CAMPEP_0114262974 /NCGR_PEP_ID=MMETSP0058-20121206/22175_1 /TAXON_ID=36894 /ORGANISM="Pyramimonas parkeae, CCMP726" /LENGTH=104 /DNA_ID=CAMNT_0001379049 /DNA_START=191 /DNA_END=505 /DNA_ORIENTATION=+